MKPLLALFTFLTFSLLSRANAGGSSWIAEYGEEYKNRIEPCYDIAVSPSRPDRPESNRPEVVVKRGKRWGLLYFRNYQVPLFFELPADSFQGKEKKERFLLNVSAEPGQNHPMYVTFQQDTDGRVWHVARPDVAIPPDQWKLFRKLPASHALRAEEMFEHLVQKLVRLLDKIEPAKPGEPNYFEKLNQMYLDDLNVCLRVKDKRITEAAKKAIARITNGK